MTKPVYIDYETVRATVNPEAKVGATKFRNRPRDTGCLHPQVSFFNRGDGKVDVKCRGCDAAWSQVKVTDVHFSERAELYLAEREAQELEREFGEGGR